MRIQNNLPAYNAHRNYNIANNAVASSTEKLSSGYRINRAGDDAAGLAISEKMRAQIRGLEMASKNSLDAVSLIQTAEGALQSTHDILQRMRELAVQASSDTNEKIIDRGALNQEFQALKKEIDDIATVTRFNDQNLIDGTFQKNIKYASSVTSDNFSMTARIGDAQAGTYTFQIKQVTTGYVQGQSFTAEAVFNTTDAVSDFTLDVTTGSSFTAQYNGVWDMSYDEATNKYTIKLGEKEFSAIGANTVTSLVTLVFSGLGTLSFTLADSVDLTKTDNQKNIAQQITSTKIHVYGGVDEEMGETKFYAELTGASAVEVTVGDKAVSFNNGITVNFDQALTAASLDRVNDASQPAGNRLKPDDASFSAADFLSTVVVDSRNGDALIIQSGANQGDELAINIDRMDANFLGVASSSIGTRSNASYAISQVNSAINKVSTQRAALGALQNRLDFKIKNLDNSAENLTAAESRIRDVDMAKEMSAFSKKNILSQAATAMLAQANSLPQNVLQLLR